MKKFLLYICMFILAACGTKPNRDIEQKEGEIVTDFYGSFIKNICRNDTSLIKDFIKEEVESLDSCYLIHYKLPINGYDIRMKVDSLAEIGKDVICKSLVILSNGEKTIGIDTFSVALPDTLYAGLRKHQINDIPYTVTHDASYNKNLKYPHLGEYQNMPLSFFDIDFDGEKEMLIRNPGVGQRSYNCYYPIKLNWKTCQWQWADRITNENENIDKTYYPLDDMTQFDSSNQTFILYKSAGWWDNEWHYFKVENGESRLIKKIIEYDKNAPKVKCISYIDKDSTMVEIPVSPDHSYTID